jgi:hypothetical protein
VIFRARHLHDDHLFDCYTAAHIGETVDPAAAEHLADCAGCRARYGDLEQFLDALRSQAESELDEVFSAEHFRAQRHQIARRLEHLVHPARVISFPGHPPAHPASSVRATVAPRWLGAAAAAGLLIGLTVGSFYYSDSPAGPATTAAVSPAPVQSAAVDSVETAPVEINTDEFLSDLEMALERPHTPELIALDAMTPHVREVRVQLR